MSRLGRAVGWTLAGAGVVAWGVASYQLVRHPLKARLRSALARALERPESDATIGDARLMLPARLVLDDVHAGSWSAGRLEVAVEPLLALEGRLHPARITGRALGTPRGQVEALEALLGDGHGAARVSLRGVTVVPNDRQLAALGVGLCEVGLELERGQVTRLAFAGAHVGGLEGLSGAAVRAADGAWLLRAARPGLQATARLGPRHEGGGLDGVATFDKLALAGLPAPHGIDLGDAHAGGTITFRSDGAEAHAQLALTLDGLTLTHPGLLRRSAENVALTLSGEVDRDADGITARDVRVALGDAHVLVDGRIDGDGQLTATASLPRMGCAALLAALPRALTPHLTGLELDGELEARLRVAADVHDAASLRLELDGDNGCRVKSDAPLADVASLAKPNPATLTEHQAGERPFALTAHNPSWRALGSLPPMLTRAFVVSEDGRFWVHHGFDVERMARALGADLDAGRIERGASTISQQVAKNLWLDGERTISRKLEEAVLTWRLEAVLPKARILELYLNLVELGPGVFGVSDGAERYFGKQPEELSADEALELASLPPAPRRGMDDAWERRYRALKARLPYERLTRPATGSVAQRPANPANATNSANPATAANAAAPATPDAPTAVAPLAVDPPLAAMPAPSSGGPLRLSKRAGAPPPIDGL